jgi:hypothetical protein
MSVLALALVSVLLVLVPMLVPMPMLVLVLVLVSVLVLVYVLAIVLVFVLTQGCVEREVHFPADIDAAAVAVVAVLTCRCGQVVLEYGPRWDLRRRLAQRRHHCLWFDTMCCY